MWVSCASIIDTACLSRLAFRDHRPLCYVWRFRSVPAQGMLCLAVRSQLQRYFLSCGDGGVDWRGCGTLVVSSCNMSHV
uniref:Uncharacterized protein n=1 Tax=Physcomitrium patens TaxID=3218 RepID=A0A2K1IQL6_PHYPA|nr:hypothetical protein PHYPA_025691 [Physcomitrium patens]